MSLCDILGFRMTDRVYTDLDFFQGHPALLLIHQGETFHFPRHTHRHFFEFVFQFEGHAVHTVNDTEVQLKPGSVLAIREKDVHELRCENFYFANLMIRTHFWDSWTKNNGIDADLFSGAKDFWLIQMGNKKSRLLEKELKVFFRFMHSKLSTLFLSRFLTFWLSESMLETLNPDTAFEQQPLWFTRAIEYIDNQLTEAIDVPSLASRLDISREHLSRSFKSLTGHSPSAFIRAKRLDAARQALVQSPDAITEIALKYQFIDLPYFYRQFKERFGLSPGQIRKQFYS